MIETARLKLIPATVDLARAELNDHRALGLLLRASIPENWPPQTLGDALPLFLRRLEAEPDQVGWFGWYALSACDPTGLPVLVASGGFLGPPRMGVAEIGYAVLPQFQGQGYATELVGGLIQWALGHLGVDRIAAETEWANPASVRVLNKAGFVRDGAAAASEGARFIYSRARSIPKESDT